MANTFFYMDCEVGENVEHKTLSPQSLQEMKNKVKAGYIAGIKDSNIAVYLIPDGLGKVMRGAGKQVIKLYNYYTDIPLASDEEIKKIGFDGIVLKCNPSIMYQYLNDHNFAEYTKALHAQEAEGKQVGKTIETSFKGIASASQVKAEGEKATDPNTEDAAIILPAFKEDGTMIEYSTKIKAETPYSKRGSQIISVLKTQRNKYKFVLEAEKRKVKSLEESMRKKDKELEAMKEIKTKTDMENRRLQGIEESFIKQGQRMSEQLETIDDLRKELFALRRELELANKKLDSKKPKRSDKPKRPVGRPKNPETQSQNHIEKTKYHREPSITQEQRELVLRMYSCGTKLADMSQYANISKTSILKIVDEAGLERRRKRR